MSARTASDPSKAQGFSLHSLWAGFLVIFVVVFPSNFLVNSVLHSCPQGCPFHSAGTPSRIRSPSFPWKSRGLSGLLFCLSPRFRKREEEGLSTGVIPRKEIVPSILEFVVKLTFIHLSWTGAGKRRCLEQEMEAWVEEAVNESSKAIDWLYSDSFAFYFFCCERSESTAGEESSDDNWSRGLPLSKESKSLIGKEILHRPIPIWKRVLLSMKAMRLCHISAYLVLWAIKYPPGGGPRKRQAIGSFPSSMMSVSLSFFHPCWVAKWAYSRSNSSIIWVGTNIGIQTPLDSIFSFDLHQSGKRRRTHLFHSERPNQATKRLKEVLFPFQLN